MEAFPDGMLPDRRSEHWETVIWEWKSRLKPGPGCGFFFQPPGDLGCCSAHSGCPAKCFSEYQPAQQPLMAGKKCAQFPSEQKCPVGKHGR